MNKQIIIAISAEPEQFRNNKIFNYEVSSQYPGASWMPRLKERLAPDVLVITADVALQLIEAGKKNASDIFVIQHVHDPMAAKLIDKGCHPFLITCFESPIYVGEFYDAANDWCKPFRYKLLPNGLFFNTNKEDELQIRFPCYFIEEHQVNNLSWEDRKFLVCVIGNKYTFKALSLCNFRLVNLVWWSKHLFLKLFFEKTFYSNVFKFNNVALQEERLNHIASLVGVKSLDLFGRGWDRLTGLPPYWQKKLSQAFKTDVPQQSEIKLITLRNYKFCLCFENAKFPGYVTEKMIEAIVAGVVPVYLGAPDIVNLIPPECYVDIRNFQTPQKLVDYLHSMTEADAKKIIDAGKKYLETNEAHSYDGFVDLVMKLFSEYKTANGYL